MKTENSKGKEQCCSCSPKQQAGDNVKSTVNNTCACNCDCEDGKCTCEDDCKCSCDCSEECACTCTC